MHEEEAGAVTARESFNAYHCLSFRRAACMFAQVFAFAVNLTVYALPPSFVCMLRISSWRLRQSMGP